MNKSIKISPFFSLLIDKERCKKREKDIKSVKFVLNESELHENEEILSAGPHFGIEATNQLINELEKLGLVYFEDFFMFQVDVPDGYEFSIKKI